MKFIKSLTLAMAFGALSSVQAKVVQILHTNDLHSYFQGTRGGIGGYAQLKTVIDELRATATAQGIPTLHLDAGDFGEGSSFYFSNHGVDSLRALDLLGIDVTVLGNHDFILGGKQLRNQMNEAKLKTTMLSANLQGKWAMGLSQKIKDYVDYNIDGMKIRIFGLTTSEVHYMYPLRPFGFISNSHNAGIKQAQKARKAGVDFTIALTHIGFENDIRLVQKSRTIDLVVGGHSHTRLGKPELTKNLSGRLIPIVQAGAHSGYIGSMIVDLQGNGEAQLIDYKMIDISKDMPQDTSMKQFVDAAYEKREKYFGRNWNEVIGFSEIPLSGNVNGHENQQRTCWSYHMARLTRKIAKADLGLQFDVFQGEEIPPGVITFGDVVDNFPHFRRWGDDGWKVSKATVSGFLLKKVLDIMANSEIGLQVVVDGIKVKDARGRSIAFNPKVHSWDRAMINNELIKNMQFYSLALPSEISFGISKLVQTLSSAILMNKRTVPKSSYWPMLENYIKENSPIRCLED